MANQDESGGIEPFNVLGSDYIALYARSQDDLECQIRERAKAGWVPVGRPYKLDQEICQLMKSSAP